MKHFDYFKFDTLGEVLDFKNLHKGTAAIIAGGSDLIVELRKNSKKLEKVDKVIDISQMKELRGIKETDDKVIIGPCVTHSEIVESDVIKKYFPLLSKACSVIGCLQTRNTGTLGGNIVNSSPAGDSLPALVAYEAKLKLLKRNYEERIVGVEEFITGPYKNVLEENEILGEIILEKPGFKKQVYGFEKVGRRNALSITRLSVSAVCDYSGGKINDIRIVTGACLPYFRRIKKAEEFLNGKEANTELLRKASEIITDDVFEEVGQRWSTPYKKPVLKNVSYSVLCKTFNLEI
jgi:carbon-monoxide dehydrogenase medium subunit/xanthine dehydrogenase FAD-binding subunit